jgi:type I site-specific restriction-modification system R (restriction) subunit
LFAQGKTPLDVAAELNIREAEATKYYREYWKLKRLYRLDQIYEDIKDDIIHIIRLYRKMKAERIGIDEVINLIKIANNDLPAVENKYHELKRDVESLESSSVLLDGKGILRLAFYSLMESMRKDPEKYGALIHYSSNNSFYGELYERLLKEQINTIITDYAPSGNLPSSPTTGTNNQLTDINKGT